jgi:hypothetical protein
MKKLLFWALLCPALSYCQIEIDTIWKQRIDSVSVNLNLANVPHGILLDKAMEFTNVPAYNGVLTDSTDLDIHVFSNIYKTLFMGRVSTDTTYFRLMQDIAYDWADTRKKENDQNNHTIVLSALLYNYSRIRSDALSQNLIRLSGNGYMDAYSSGWQNPYETLTTVAFAPPINIYSQLEFDVMLPPELFLSNALNGVTAIEIDFYDGNGYQSIYNQTVHVRYGGPGKKAWTLRISQNSGPTLYARAYLVISEPEIDTSQSSYSNDIFISGPGNESVIANKGAFLRIDYAPGHNGQVIKPFIVAEGFDVGSILTPEEEGGDRTIEDFLFDVSSNFRAGDLSDLLYDNNFQDYDIIYVDWQNGTNSLQYNAAVLRKVILWVNEQKHINTSNEDNVLLGQSMGGVIGRYCLAKMEADEIAHEVRLFIAHDAPIQGANTPISLQHFTRHMYSLYTDAPVYGVLENFIPVIEDFWDLIGVQLLGMNEFDFPSPEDILTIQDTPAAVQMNYHYVDIGAEETTAIHDLWINELENAGYPHECRSIAISNGNECAVDHGFDPREKLIDLHDTHNPDIFGDFVHFVATPLAGIAMGDIELAILGLLPGSSKYFFDFDLHANPNLGDTNRKIYYGRIKYEKKLLWLIKISHTITSRTKHAPSGYLPFDTYSGGSVNIERAIDNDGDPDPNDYLPSNIYENPIYGFIPVVSALDIKRSAGDVVPEDYLEKYAGGLTPDPLLTSSFQNFIVGYSQSFTNEPHISFNARNGDWLAEELNAGGTTPNYPEYNCSYVCENIEIEGDITACSIVEFSLPEAPALMDYEWEITEGDNLVTIDGEETNEIELTVLEDAVGAVTIQVTFGDDANKCADVVLSKTIWVGKPTFQNFTCHSLGNDFCSGSVEVSSLPWLGVNDRVTAHFEGLTSEEENDADNWEWEAINTKVTVNDSKDVCFIGMFGEGLTGVRVRAQNACGWSEWQELYFDIDEVYDPFERRKPLQPNFKVYPNPSDYLVYVTVIDKDKNSENEPSKGEIFDALGRLATTFEINKGQATINVSGLETGIYFLRAEINGKVEVRQISVY